MSALVRSPNKIERFIRLPDIAGAPVQRFVTLEQTIVAFSATAVSRLQGQGAGQFPRHPRQRHRGRGRGGGSRAPVRERAEAPPPRLGDPARDRSVDAGIAAQLRHRRRRRRAVRRRLHRGHAGAQRTVAARQPRPARPEVHALQSALSRARARERRRLLRGDPAEGPRRPSPLRDRSTSSCSSCTQAARDPERRGDQADALSHLRRTARSCARWSRRPKPASR